MTFGVSAAGLLAVGGSLGLSAISSNQQAKAAKGAANTQARAAQAGIDEQHRQFDDIQKLLAPFVGAGTDALTAQQNILGLNGSEAETAAINGIKSGPTFNALVNQGENSILQNASATGGLRGGNIQSALAQFSPGLLSQLIQQHYQNLGGLSSMGQNAAAGVGNAGLATGNNVANLLQQKGAAVAGGQLAQGNQFANVLNGGANLLGMYSGLGGKF